MNIFLHLLLLYLKTVACKYEDVLDGDSNLLQVYFKLYSAARPLADTAARTILIS